MLRGALSVAALCALVAATSGAASAQNLATAPPGASACLGCHAGPDNALPSLRGSSAAEIAAAMTAFRTGARDATVMDRIAKGFSEPETQAIANWLAEAGGAR